MPRPPAALVVAVAVTIFAAYSSYDAAVTSPEQELVIQIFEEGRRQYVDAPNEIKKDEVEAARDLRLCDPSLVSPEGWVGEIHELSTGPWGLELQIRIGDSVDLRTSHVSEHDPVVKMARELQEEDTVTFDGKFELVENCLNPESFFQQNRMTQPDFDFTITSLTKA